MLVEVLIFVDWITVWLKLLLGATIGPIQGVACVLGAMAGSNLMYTRVSDVLEAGSLD